MRKEHHYELSKYTELHVDWLFLYRRRSIFMCSTSTGCLLHCLLWAISALFCLILIFISSMDCVHIYWLLLKTKHTTFQAALAFFFCPLCLRDCGLSGTFRELLSGGWYSPDTPQLSPPWTCRHLLQYFLWRTVIWTALPNKCYIFWYHLSKKITEGLSEVSICSRLITAFTYLENEAKLCYTCRSSRDKKVSEGDGLPHAKGSICPTCPRNCKWSQERCHKYRGVAVVGNRFRVLRRRCTTQSWALNGPSSMTARSQLWPRITNCAVIISTYFI